MRYNRCVQCLLWLLVACLLLPPIFTHSVHGQARPVEEDLVRYYAIVEELQELEEEILTELVNLEFQLADQARQVSLLSRQLEQLQEELPSLEAAWGAAHERYVEVRASTQKALRMMQLWGPASYLEVLSGAVSLRDFVQRLNGVVVLVQGTMDLLFNLRESQAVLAERYDRLNAYYEEQQRLYQEAKERRGILERMHAEKEAALEQLGVERSSYERALAYTEAAWLEETGEFLQDLHQGFQQVLARVMHPPSGVEMVQEGSMVTIIIPAEVLNQLLWETPALTGVVLVLAEDRTQLIVPDRLLSLAGPLQLAGGARVRLVVEEIAVATAVLADETRDELMETVDIVLDFAAVTTGLRMQSLSVDAEAVTITATMLIPFIF